ncbi:DUF2490 domain-containing protein [Halioglobus pacificus]|uniref:Uncharacterized protein n=1 Tax=Parahalioglobus pacificus TaxID=930806 RepID=A0A918XKE7_9GAMM|nr:DUF2490 domain-containing protein [Halioglobus pacificus]GHD36131.1 hypothetical protein GCM10007053_24170 [Halioglobus pacificus]
MPPRSKVRSALFMDIPINNTVIKRGTWYAAAYNEVFLNLEQDIRDGREVETFDRNRLYGAIGYAVRYDLKVQADYMYQSSDTVDKEQLQFSLHHNC